MTSISTINVPFHGDNLYVVNYNGQPYVPMKPIVEGMGLTWQSQFEKLKQRFSKGITEIVIPSKGGEQSMLCLALRKLAGWLHTISPKKVKPEIRDKVIRYQEECDDVLYEYWTTGEVKNKRKGQKILPGKITAEQQEAIKQLVMTRGKALPKEKQAKAMITMWSSLKSHFGCTYKEIGSDKFTEALSLAARVPLEGEYIPAQEVLPEPVGITFTEDETLALVTMCNAANFAQQEAKAMYPAFVEFGSRFTGSIYDIAHSNGIFVRNGTKVLMDKLSGLRLSGKAWTGALNRLTMNA
ncbi:phage antirepressor N-terminal domain-containing protein [Morganella morganii]|uniref:phage antirepressor N-terminal domain-containing protein n=1 Tax=Morganella morganii TaxID=582 RepID=UPI001646220C|nr:phage antirepressor N-terminal domain-containing protein [Morganella morganii]MBC3968019.1 phage antirepressor Ant [Morganella morganii]